MVRDGVKNEKSTRESVIQGWGGLQGEIPLLLRLDFTIPVVLCSSCKRGMKIQRILLEGGILPLSTGSGN